MIRKVLLLFSLLITLLLLGACSATEASPTPATKLPNPASVKCEQDGGMVEMKLDASGGEFGICIFPDGSECDEWAYFRGECAPGGEVVAPEPTLAPQDSGSNPPEVDELASDGCKVYRDEALSYSFHYPADAQIVMDDNPLNSITISGTSAEEEYWPQITLSHPNDREDYRPPADADLLSWLTEHNLLGDERGQDMQIAGTTAIHERHERSSQSYAYDRYYFAHSGQLYMLVIGHVADKEEWEVYNHILESFQFED